MGRIGVFAEPAGATAFAGIEAAIAKELIKPDDPVLALVTGSGLKDVKSAMLSVNAAPVIKPDLDEVIKVVGK